MPKIYGDLEFQGTARVVADNNGTALLPAITFASDVNTGIYRHAADVLGFSTNGVLRLLINDEGALVLSDVPVTPSTTTNKLYADGGSLFWNGSEITGISFPLLAPDGTAGDPSYSFTSDSDVGMYRVTTNTLGFSVGGNNVVEIGIGGITMAAAATVLSSLNTSAPTFSFVGDTNTGMSGHALGDRLEFFTGGTNTLEIRPTYLRPLIQIRHNLDGTAGAPSYSFNSNQTTGIFKDGAAAADPIAFSVNSQESLNIESDGTLNVAAVTNYEALVLADDDIPNKKYVDDEIANVVGVTTAVTFTTYTATASQTTFTGADDNANVLAYTAGFIDVHLNGVLLEGTAYTATNGTSVVLNTGADAGDVLQTTAYITTTIMNAYTKVESDGMFANKALANTFSEIQTIKASGNSVWKVEAFDVTGDSAFQGMIINGSDGIAAGFIGSIPGDGTSQLTGYTWDTTAGPAAWNRVLGFTEDAGVLEVTDLDITFNGTSLLSPTISSATETTEGIAELATQAETDAGTDDNRIVTPLKLANYSGLGGVSGSGVQLIEYTASAGQTVFGGPDNNAVTLAYTVGQLYVYKNGVLLEDTVDYVATTGSSIVLNVAAALNDVVQATAFSTITGSGASATDYTYTATAGQTTFTGLDDNSETMGYNAGDLLVYLNGALLINGTDYTATDGTDVVLTVAASAGNVLQVYEWASFLIGESSDILNQFIYTATASQTTFTGADDNANTLAYSSGDQKVYLNGALLEQGTDYTASNGTSVVLTSPAALNDIIQITAFGTFSVANHYTKGEIDNKYSKFSIQFLLPVGANDTYTMQQSAQFGFTIDKAYYQTSAGTITGNVQIGGVSVTGMSALSFTSTEGNSTATDNRVVAEGDKVTLVTTSTSGATMVSIILHCTRT